MENKVLFKETQRFRQWWIWLILLLINVSSIWFLIEKYVYKKQFPDTAYHSYSGAGIFGLILILITILFLSAKLTTKISADGIEARFSPFHFHTKKYLWDDIISAKVRQYSPLKEYGGWGIRFGSDGKAYNVLGNKGIQVVFKDGSKLLIGTQKPDEAAQALSNFIPKK